MNGFFTDIKLTTFTQGKRLRVRPLEGQEAPVLWVSCPRAFRSQMPLGTIFTADLKLIQVPHKKPYLKAVKRNYQQLRFFLSSSPLQR